ncbi:tetratricopeptide repeat protein [Bacillus sp. DX1.1]|uniref:tetratricopeptide repeat protein n=1 Tax=unclassified Bacillus (in: firmicutes) TaxID=185979 RepID=UPI0025709C04|nr:MULTISPECIES: tetratricopeptide repeat protein [unclassified Bacillus (in: firmicutes)]MDM5157224.1 tetratricopeptide repeat protein [Bacillus sp. DX1.1]WJE81455.1 tetratricopeptide repeat protein [Bacillus sp. DX3.1]
MGKNQRIYKGSGQVISFNQLADFFYKKGMKSYRNHKLQDAIKYFRRAAQSEKEPFILCQLATVLSEAGEYQESNQIFLKLIRSGADIEQCYYFVANNYAYLGLFQQAKKYADQYLEVATEKEFVEETLELLEIMDEEAFDEEEFEDEDELIVMQEQANRYIRNGQLEEAIETLEIVTKDYPEFWSGHNNLAIAHFQLGNVDEALKLTEMILEKNPGNMHALCNTLIFLYSIGEHKQAEHLAEQLETVYPISFEHRLKLGTTFATIGHFASAYKWLKLLKRQGYEGDVSFYYWFAYSAYMVKDQHTAEKMWQSVVELHPDKKGKEPWNALNLADEGQNILFEELRKSFQQSETLEEQMLALYLMNELTTPEKISFFFDAAQSLNRVPIVSQLAKYFFLINSHKSITAELQPFEQCVRIADALYNYTKKDDELIEECLHFWFCTFIRLYTSGTMFTNVFGWSSAIEYIVRGEQRDKMTQAELGNIYNVSVATVRKYVQAVKRTHA